MKQTIMFDLDDTLVHCNKYFYLVIDQFVDLMKTWFASHPLTTDEIRDRQTEIDIAGVQTSGFKSEHFPESFVETYRYFAGLYGRKTNPAEEDNLWKLGLSVYESETEPYPYMEETLLKLQMAGHDLHLYTGGEPLIQFKKIERFQLERYFDERIYVRQHKDIQALESIVSEQGFDRDNTWMVGNSIRTDIVPALTAGIHAIYIPTETEWQYNIVEINVEPKGQFLTLQHLPDVPTAINEYAAGK
ncbi:HAD family hydrolase [Paenibacillus sambharensis]|uniref:HAD family hydrolase n=1 Tax=Paenibacillus sambharensis TaxID=1803190 RepID=A0A2W1LF46_9BACL|nr:HAD family hydrolase [Paenibacillus sambharensis]PZD93692.1 HAD family hydrolase [Paenibacillus sambharensis]